jgi:hypothetical protein
MGRWKAAPDLADRHRRWNQVVRLGDPVRRLEVFEDLREHDPLGRAGVLEWMLSAATGVQAVRGEDRSGDRRALDQDLDGKLRIEHRIALHDLQHHSLRASASMT